MARQGITKAQVFEVADLLRAEGVDASPGTVRERTGSGSFTTIKKFLDEWREANPLPVQEVPETPDVVQHAMRQVWVVAAKEAEEHMRVERAALEAERKAFERERLELEHEVTRLEEVGDKLQSKLDTCTADVNSLQKQLEKLRSENAVISADKAVALERANSIEQQHKAAAEQVKHLQAELVQIARGTAGKS